MASESTMTDAMGNQVPVRYVSKYDKARDRGVRRIHARWLKARAYLEQVMADSLDDLGKIAIVRDSAGIPSGEKGNLQVSSFDGLITVGLNVRYEIHLDERVVKARELMLDYARSLASLQWGRTREGAETRQAQAPSVVAHVASMGPHP